MSSVLAYLREFNFLSSVVRLALALAVGGIIGYGRSKKQRSAGLRTYMLTTVGAALTILIAMYEYEMLSTKWSDVVDLVGLKYDGSRYSAQVITGVGFLAAGTIVGTAHQQVSGLTTAIGLFASACLGIAAGSGFYEVVLIGAVLIILSMEALQPLEINYKRRLKNITMYVEYDDPQDLDAIKSTITDRGGHIFDLDIEPMKPGAAHHSAILSLRMGNEHPSHSGMLSSVAELPCVYAVRELIS